ncbi:bifunctional isocitrate dehydrogenase kinase/phosphatase [Nitrincola tapanii]|uniref:Isocitrate dehydrogenase kinase/phosphatase n=1 Tax=Nitrincola tapanii TaxID=1708751 RepID=A0A5A9VYL9_9GAMM|nr:bifunctional isocitrate dehydrogenase kinase/phosphatase [Nitrincola tapanii]KAA0873637.1 bifunctional isocitrate dehydrogenase kinase/phosphatase [Nitrincola tapanii]
MHLRHPAERASRLIYQAFGAYRADFRHLTLSAADLFETADWRELQKLSAQRIDLYDAYIHQANQSLQQRLTEEVLSQTQFWQLTAERYQVRIESRMDRELAATFFNSVLWRQKDRLSGSVNASALDLSFSSGRLVAPQAYCRTYTTEEGLVKLLQRLFRDFSFAIPWENARRDLRNIIRYLRTHLPEDGQLAQVDVIRSVFYRNKAAYLVGRISSRYWHKPFVLAVLNNDAGAVYVDTLVTDEDDVSVIFSFTRSYFLVDVPVPSAFIDFLHSLIPMKSTAELYTSLGFYKQGKAEFYRDFSAHLMAAEDLLQQAPGVPGMVMMVFTLPSFPVVFKVIKDRFSSSKKITAARVNQCYQLVKRHDRVGRMADTFEFRELSLPQEKFEPEFLQQLLALASRTVTLQGDKVLFSQVWAERRMTPLNLYLEQAMARNDEGAIFHAINEYGKAIRQLAVANIFAGDMLFKNFGITRHGRVVFYDYDEIQYLTDCNFREIPEPLYPEQELAGEPWYDIGPNDVFPEEFTLLTACDTRIRRIFNQQHGDLLEAHTWREMQEQVRRGEVVDVFPYRQHQRFLR